VRFFFLFLFFIPILTCFADNTLINEGFENIINSKPDTKEKVNYLNNTIDKLLKPIPTVGNCKKALPLALKAAKIAEKLDYKTGMARSYEQLTLVYKTLDYQIQYLIYKRKAVIMDRGAELKKQTDEIEKQKVETETIKKEIEELEKDNNSNKELIIKKQQELAQKEKALDETFGLLSLAKEEAEHLANQNKILEQDKKIKDLEVLYQKEQKYFLLSLLGVFLILAVVLFKLYKTKHQATIELEQKNEIIEAEKNRSDELLLNILPLETANELKATGKATTRHYGMVTVLFTDFKDFTLISEQLSSKDLVDEIDVCYCAFDTIIEKYGIEKIKTIGDAYLCAFGIAHDIAADKEHDPSFAIDAAFEIIEFMDKMYERRTAEGRPFFRIRIGLNSGPLVAGVVGRKKFAYDIWGDTVNIAARMEQNSEPGKINISESTQKMVSNKYNFTHRGKISAKNKGEIDMYFVDGRK